MIHKIADLRAKNKAAYEVVLEIFNEAELFPYRAISRQFLEGLLK